MFEWLKPACVIIVCRFFKASICGKTWNSAHAHILIWIIWSDILSDMMGHSECHSPRKIDPELWKNVLGASDLAIGLGFYHIRDSSRDPIRSCPHPQRFIQRSSQSGWTAHQESVRDQLQDLPIELLTEVCGPRSLAKKKWLWLRKNKDLAKQRFFLRALKKAICL